MSTCSLYSLRYSYDPAEYFKRVRHAPGAVLLDSGRPEADRGRFDLLSAWPLEDLVVEPGESGTAFLQRLRDSLEALGPAQLPAESELPFVGGLIGYLAYDFGRRLEPLPAQSIDDLELPDARLGLYAWAVVSDHQARTTQLVCHPALPQAEQQRLLELFCQPVEAAAPEFRLEGPFQADLSALDYSKALARIQDYIQSGDCYQVNFAQRFQARCEGEPWAAYCALRAACPTPFSGYMQLPDGGAILSLSPERFVKVSESQVETRPIKGTRPRGRDAVEDTAYARELLASPKDRAENLMIVDLLRNDLGRSCTIGSVKVPELFSLESYPNVHHLVSSVTGELAVGKDALDLIAGSFPGGSITGAPKIRAMQIIDELEPTRRALYCGSLMYMDVRGEMDSSIAIRSLLVKDGSVSCWGGGGIVADSDCESEYQESFTKVRVLLRTLENLVRE
ncbi:aminodeoxychorismate synthase component I [Pseudomonas cichorii]|uniref:Aminodeoxychorismate synthase component I n=1 Tax=Pseudomonas lijiangensis TaxID=2995658 RepID=A0ABX8HKT2_9PSED|nr:MULTISPECIES: aminodeoxychorismate synthase component I [Pseudomonas syringae group]MBX8492240.1 aminodeoxychorismate synthase component I [Pseudomonas cichorii]MBX8501411.1 aminodeoxychorismate synthase component I [Pseudomonas lijiangensis]MBX8506369.1 aminodeoxychorismate synthase component I [Pseudomonas lijiangensis]MBX8512955.1 aminodeoxychorismate synthase component I [Pseudomonas cichorii]MBX8522974.1 aminodeoxychorismate synthase component I [Pseudomonas cichorii]